MKAFSVALQCLQLLKSKRELQAIAVLVLLSGSLSCLQSSPLQPEPSSASTILITARGKDGAAVELFATDLAIKVDGRYATVRQVRHLSRPPLHYCVVFDTSKSELPVFRQQQAAAKELLAKVVHAQSDRGWFIPFSDDPRPTPETNSSREIADAIAKEKSNGGTALYDAMVSCSERMRQSPPDPGLRAMFILSDGGDNESRASQEETVESLLMAEVRVYVVGQEPARPNAANTLRRFAIRTGGKVSFLKKGEGIAAAVADIADELANVFAVEYTLPGQKPDNRLHKLEVQCNQCSVKMAAPERLLRR